VCIFCCIGPVQIHLMLGLFGTGHEDETKLNGMRFAGTLSDGKKHGNTQETTAGSPGDGIGRCRTGRNMEIIEKRRQDHLERV